MAGAFFAGCLFGVVAVAGIRLFLLLRSKRIDDPKREQPDSWLLSTDGEEAPLGAPEADKAFAWYLQGDGLEDKGE